MGSSLKTATTVFKRTASGETFGLGRASASLSVGSDGIKQEEGGLEWLDELWGNVLP